MISGFLRLALMGCVLTFVTAAPPALSNDRMAGPVPVSKPDPEAKKAVVPPPQKDERTVGVKQKADVATKKPAAAKTPVKPKTEAVKPAKAPVKTPPQDAAAKTPVENPDANPDVKKADTTTATPRPRTGNTMDRKEMESLGPLTNPLNGSLGNDMWAGSSRSTLLKYIPLLPTGDAIRPAQLLARRVLLSNGDVKMLDHNSGSADSPDLFTLRIEKLLEMGAYDDAVELYTLIEGEPSHDRLGRAGIMALMSGGYPAQACLEARAVHHDFATTDDADEDNFWRQIESICTFIQIQSAKTILRNGIQTISTKGFDRSAITGIPGSRVLTTLASRPDYRHTVGSPKDIEELSAIERAVIKGLGRFDYSRLKLKRPQDIPTRVLMIMATDRNLQDHHRATLNVEAARRGVIDAARLGKVYADLAGKEDKLGVDPASLRLWDRYALYNKSTDEAERKRMVAALLEGPAQGLPVALLPFADTVSGINPATLSANAVRNGLLLMLYNNTVPPERWVTAWLQAESGDSVKKPDSVVLYLANILLENLPTNSIPFPDDSLKPWFQGPELTKSLEIWSLFSGLGRENTLHNVAAQDVYEKHVDLTLANDYVMPTDGLLEQIREASNNDRLGEVALLAAVALNEYSPGKTHPGVFREVLQSLITVGLKEEAQQVALGVVLSLEQ